MSVAIRITDLYKEYRLGVIGSGTLYRDLQSWVANIQGKEDPNSLIGQSSEIVKKEKILALNNINLDIKKGEVLGIIGMNGAGKSTLLKVLSKVTAPTKGSIKYKGHIASLLEVGTGFHPELTGRENIYLNGAINGMQQREMTKKIDEIVDFAGVEKFLDTPVKRYSSGMFVRLGFAVAAHLDPDILIVDEVLAVGDAAFRAKALGKMKEKSKGEGRTVLFVSHNMESIKTLCSRTILMSNGSVVGDGSAEEIVNKYLSFSQQKVEEFAGERVWEQDSLPGNKHIKLKSIRTKNNNNSIMNEFDVTEDIIIDFEYIVTSEDLPIGFSMLLSNNQNTIFSSFDNHIQHDWSNQPLHEKGHFVNSCYIPGNMLNEGVHSINLWCYSPPLNPNSAPHIKLLETLSFRVVDNYFGDSARGSFPYSWTALPTTRPKLKWRKIKV